MHTPRSTVSLLRPLLLLDVAGLLNTLVLKESLVYVFSNVRPSTPAAIICLVAAHVEALKWIERLKMTAASLALLSNTYQESEPPICELWRESCLVGIEGFEWRTASPISYQRHGNVVVPGLFIYRGRKQEGELFRVVVM